MAGGSGSMTGRRTDHMGYGGAEGELIQGTEASLRPSDPLGLRQATGSVLHEAGTCNPISEA